ncbi:MAG: MMPL family transporter, partial [Pseudomonadota bacterium]
MTVGLGLERPGLWALRYPVVAALLLLAVIAGALLSVPQLRFDDDINRVFLSDNKNSQEYREFISRLGGKPTDLALLIEHPEAFSAADVEAMRTLALELEFADGVVSTLSPYSVRFSPIDALYPDQPLIPGDVAMDKLAERLEYFSTQYPASSAFISPQMDTALFVLSGGFDLPSEEVRALTSDLDRLAGETLTGNVSFTITGESVISLAIADGLKDDLLRLNALGGAMVLVLAIVVLRSAVLALLAFVPALTGVVVTLGLFVLLDYPVTVISNVLPILVLVFGVADSMHLLLHVRENHTSETAGAKVAATITDIGPACALSAITTAIGFLAVSLSGNQQLVEFALAGAASVVATYLTTLVLFALLGRFAIGRGTSRTTRGSSLIVLEKIADMAWRRDRIIIGFGVLALACGLWGYANTVSWFPYEKNLPSDSPLIASNKKLTDTFGGTYRLWAEIDLNEDQSLQDPVAWQRVADVTAAMTDAAPNYATVSLSTFANWLGTSETVPGSDELENLPGDLRDLLFPAEGGIARIVMAVPEPMKDRQSLVIQDRLEQAALAAGADRVVGLPVIMRYESIAIIEQLGRGLLVACLLATLVIAIAFRWPSLLILLLAPNIIPLAVAAAALHIIDGSHLTPTAVLALIIAFGIAVNDSIHFASRYRLELNHGLDQRTALLTSVSHTGRVMVLTTV